MQSADYVLGMFDMFGPSDWSFCLSNDVSLQTFSCSRLLPCDKGKLSLMRLDLTSESYMDRIWLLSSSKRGDMRLKIRMGVLTANKLLFWSVMNTKFGKTRLSMSLRTASGSLNIKLPCILSFLHLSICPARMPVWGTA